MSDIKRKLGILEIKHALLDERFQKLFPELEKEITAAMRNPGCACNRGLYTKILGYPDRLKQYFPGADFASTEDAQELSKNNFIVINCQINELEGRLARLGPGRKEIAVARYQDSVTAIVNNLSF